MGIETDFKIGNLLENDEIIKKINQNVKILEILKEKNLSNKYRYNIL